MQGLTFILNTTQTALQCKHRVWKTPPRSPKSAGESDLGEVSALGGLDGILGDVVPEDEARVGAVHHPHPLLLRRPHVALALQLQGQTLPVGSDKPNRTVRQLQERVDGRLDTPFPLHSLSLSVIPFISFCTTTHQHPSQILSQPTLHLCSAP